jgi:predicted metal-binding membrane protein
MSRSMFVRRDLTSASILATVAASWGILIVWTNSPYSVYLGHSELADVASVVQLLPLALVFLAGWIVMMFAMMIPAAASFVAQFRLRKSGEGLILPLLLGYLAIWALFGLTAYFSDLGLHRLSDLPLLQGHTWVFGSSALVLAAAYQFTSTKNQFLRDCCYPSDFIQAHWTSQRGALGAIRLGFAYGKSSVGSGWAVMLLMFALGLGSVLWMVAFAAVMVSEGLVEWGPKIRLPLGIVLAGIATYSALVALGL